MNSEAGKTENSCVVCFKEVLFCSVGVCEHSVCYECSARMRVLLGQKECPICRKDLEHVVFTKGNRSYRELTERLRMFILDPRYQIYMENGDIKKHFDKLLESRCRFCKDGEKIIFKDFSALRTHVQRTHDVFACDLCVEHIKLFPVERRFYNRVDLATHKRKGDKDDTSFRGHPLCQFCDRRYFDDDDLFKHLRKDHYFCHFCDADGLNQFYDTYDDLRVHFRCEHFLCEEENCKDEKFTSVFRTKIDLKAHLASVHSRLLGRHGLKQTRQLDVEFNLLPRPNEIARARRRGERSDRGGDRGDRGDRSGQGERERDTSDNQIDPSNDMLAGAPNRDIVQVPSAKAQINLESSMDFPTLGGAPSNGVPQISSVMNPPPPGGGVAGAGLSAAASQSQTASKRIALSNGLNVSSRKSKEGSSKPNWNAKVSGSSRLDEEFPALQIHERSMPSTSYLSGLPPTKSFINATKVTTIPPPAKNPDVKTRQSVPRSEDFPDLPCSSRARAAAPSAWNGPSVKMKKGRGEYQGKKVAPAPMLPSRSAQSSDAQSSNNGYFDYEEDFKFVPLSLSEKGKSKSNNNVGNYQHKKT